MLLTTNMKDIWKHAAFSPGWFGGALLRTGGLLLKHSDFI